MLAFKFFFKVPIFVAFLPNSKINIVILVTILVACGLDETHQLELDELICSIG